MSFEPERRKQQPFWLSRPALSWRHALMLGLLLYGLALAVIATLAGTAISTRSPAKDASQDQLRQLDLLLTAYHRAESAQRGFLITGDNSYVDDFETTVQVIERLRQDIAADPVLEQMPATPPETKTRLTLLSADKLAEMHETIDLRRRGQISEVQDRVLRADGRRLMVAIADELQAAMARLRTQMAVQQQQELEWKVRRVLGTALTVALVLLAGLGLVLRRHWRRQQVQLQASLDAFAQVQLHWHQLLRALPIACILTDRDLTVRNWNPACTRYFGDSEAAVQGRSVFEVWRLCSDKQEAAEARRQLRESGEIQAFVGGLYHLDGHEQWCEWYSTRLCDGGGRVLGTLILGIDINAQRHKDAQLRALSQQLILVQAQERARIAQVLHDQLGQNLVAIQVTLDAVLLQVQQTTSVQLESRLWRKLLPTVLRLLTDSLGDLRQLLVELRPPLLQEFGLLAALQREVETLQQRLPDRRIHLLTPARHCPRWSEPVELGAFQILREALRNAVNHSQAPDIWLQADEEGERCCFSVVDNGVGFADAYSAQAEGHLGLLGMRERAASIEAELSIVSQPGQGCRISLWLGHGHDDPAESKIN